MEQAEITINGNGNDNQLPQLKPRKYPELYQAYRFWYELVEMRKRHLLRISAVERGVCSLSVEFERKVMDRIKLDDAVEYTRQEMIRAAEAVPIWEWIASFKGLGAGGLAAQLIAQIDDTGNFPTISSLWRFAGYAVIDGRREYRKSGEKAHYSAHLKSTCYLISEQFLRAQTKPWIDVYYEYKGRKRREYPEPWCDQCNLPASVCGIRSHRKRFTDNHLHLMAMRKMTKVFLSNLWLSWRTAEGLPVSEPYVQAVLGHTDMVLV